MKIWYIVIFIFLISLPIRCCHLAPFQLTEKSGNIRFVNKYGASNILRMSIKISGRFEIKPKWNVMWTELVFTPVWNLKPLWVHFASHVNVLWDAFLCQAPIFWFLACFSTLFHNLKECKWELNHFFSHCIFLTACLFYMSLLVSWPLKD